MHVHAALPVRSGNEPGNERIVAVVVFDVDIPAGTDLDQVIKNYQLELVQVPADVIVDGTVTSVDQLSHRRTRVAIHAGEPILAGWLKKGLSEIARDLEWGIEDRT